MAQNNGVAFNKKKNTKSIIVIMGLVIALWSVIYAMQYVQSGNFRKGLELLFGSVSPTIKAESRVWNWCPKETGQVEFYTSRASEDSVRPEEICEVVIEPVPEQKAKRQLKRYLTVGSGEFRKTLEADEAVEVFRVDGLVFQSQILSKILKGY